MRTSTDRIRQAIASAGVADGNANNRWAIAIPAGTPGKIVEVDIRTPEEIRRMIPLDMEKWAKVAREAGMKGE